MKPYRNALNQPFQEPSFKDYFQGTLRGTFQRTVNGSFKGFGALCPQPQP